MNKGEVTAQPREEFFLNLCWISGGGDQSDDVDNVNPVILGMMAEKISSKIEPSDFNNYKVDNCPENTESLLSDGFGETK
jgi:hypothetical protein